MRTFSSYGRYYLAGTADGSRAGVFYVNVANLRQRPKYEMVALALHEGIPGHHLPSEPEHIPLPNPSRAD